MKQDINATMRQPAGRSGNPVARLSDPSLFVQSAFIDGCWRDAANGKVIAVTDPATGERIGTIPDMGGAETAEAIDAAKRAYGDWRRMTAYERADILHRWAGLMRDAKEDLSIIMVAEQGKPLSEARGEIDYAISFFDWFAEEGKRHYGETIPSHLPGSRMVVMREPVGVTAAITPWNFPSAMITRKAGAALAAGCPMIVRPASETPYSALALAVLAERAGVPAGVFSVVTGGAREIASALQESPDVRKISFTGSTEVGRILLQGAAPTVKKVSMELGGHAPFIVFEDADLDLAVDGAVKAKMATTGQDCLAANRLIVHESLYDAFCDKFAKAIGEMKIGHGFEDGVEVGPLMSDGALAKCEEHVADALSKGGKILTGGKRSDLGGLFFEPTVIKGMTTDMAIWSEETFGPVAPVMRFADEDEAVRLANDTIYGLAAYFYTKDLDRSWRVSEALEYGMVALNTPKMTGAPIPFGGVKQSGLGREGSRHGLDDYSEIKYVCMGGVAR